MKKEFIHIKIDWFGDRVTARFHKQELKHEWEAFNIAAYPESGFIDIRTYIHYRIVKAMYDSGKFKDIRVIYERAERSKDVRYGWEQGYTQGRKGEEPKIPELKN